MTAGTPALGVSNSAPADVDVFAVQSGAGVNVAVVNRAAVPVTVHLSLASQAALRQIFLVDDHSYSEVYNTSSNSTSLVRAGISVISSMANGSFTITGYGFALAQFVAMGAPH
jgi:zona occludens toxin (predicted ATPase)